MVQHSLTDLETRIQELESRLEESEQLVEAIKAGEVDAFAIQRDEGSEVYTLQSGDYAYRVLVEQFQEGAINVTEDGLIVYTNAYFFNLLNLPYENVVGSSIFDLIHPDSRNWFKRLFNDALKGKSKGEINLIVNARSIPVYVSLSSLQPKLPTIGMIISDLSEKKKIEQIILDYQKDLEAKNLSLLQTNAELASFAYIASHDLQEPLRKIQTFSTRIMEKDFNNISEGGKDHFNRMQASARRMQTLIEDLLTYSRTNTLGRKFEDVDLDQLVKEVKAELKEELQQKEAVIDTTEMCHAHIIPFQFRQLLYNLISNALKFSHPSRPPQIKIKSEIVDNLKMERLPPEKKYCHITVSDNGIGFEQEYSEKIFDLFQRLHGKAQYNGTGIGLAIVKKIVDNHHGVISAKGQLNKGATFDIYIPAP
jgi:PAS domain S-box-containing protein